jgi:hypothetical protein
VRTPSWEKKKQTDPKSKVKQKKRKQSGQKEEGRTPDERKEVETRKGAYKR